VLVFDFQRPMPRNRQFEAATDGRSGARVIAAQVGAKAGPGIIDKQLVSDATISEPARGKDEAAIEGEADAPAHRAKVIDALMCANKVTDRIEDATGKAPTNVRTLQVGLEAQQQWPLLPVVPQADRPRTHPRVPRHEQ